MSLAGLAEGSAIIVRTAGPLAASICVAVLYVTTLVTIVWLNGPPAFDFRSFWTAAQYALEGRPADAYLLHMQGAAQQRIFDVDTEAVAFAYPPTFLLAIMPLGLMPYTVAALVWVAGTLVAFLAALRTLVPTWSVLLGLAAFPAVYWNITYGQNGFVTAALLALAVSNLGPRPWLAGLCIGLLAYKPHLGLIIPLALAAGGHWRSFLGATITVIATSAAATLVFGPEIWRAFLGMTGEAQSWLSRQPDYLRHLITVYAAARLLGANEALAYIVHLAVALPCLAVLLLLIRRRACARAQGAAMVCCTALCTPYLLRYDMVLLTIPMAWLWVQTARTGYPRFELAVLATAYLAAAPRTVHIGGAELLLAPFAILAVFVAIARRTLRSPGPMAEANHPAANPRTYRGG